MVPCKQQWHLELNVDAPSSVVGNATRSPRYGVVCEPHEPLLLTELRCFLSNKTLGAQCPVRYPGSDDKVFVL